MLKPLELPCDGLASSTAGPVDELYRSKDSHWLETGRLSKYKWRAYSKRHVDFACIWLSLVWLRIQPGRRITRLVRRIKNVRARHYLSTYGDEIHVRRCRDSEGGSAIPTLSTGQYDTSADTDTEAMYRT